VEDKVTAYNNGNANPLGNDIEFDSDGRRIRVDVVLTGEQAAAVEGWRVANRIGSQPEAVKELVRIGLLSEIGRVYRMIAGNRDGEEALQGIDD
jgi:hypothetical protein